jgi:adenosylcobinamide kinase/adenosylcobinamide-phosphate guanylyltransferase
MSTPPFQLILVLGGCRSGKSNFALRLASRLGRRKLFVATATAFDDEMRERIAKHRAARGPDWTTVEEPLAPGRALSQSDAHDVAVIDCLTLWLGNLLHHNTAAGQPFAELLDQLGKRRSHVIAVSNEVGLGIVPDNPLARRFRDEQGRLNQQIAAIADTVVLMAAGLPMTLKGKPPEPLDS